MEVLLHPETQCRSTSQMGRRYATTGAGHGMKGMPLVSDSGQDEKPVLQLSVNKIGILQMIFLLLTSSSSFNLLLLTHFVLDMPTVEMSPFSSLSQDISYPICRQSSLLHSSSFRVKNLLISGHPTGLFL